MRRLCIFLLLATASLLAPALSIVRAATIDDVILHYKFDDVSGAVFADSGINGNHATLYRFLTYAELPAIDASHAMGGLGSPFDGAVFVGTRNISDVSHELMIDVPASTALPGTGDNFAVSFWLRVANWSTSWGIVGAYNLNGLDWVIGTHNTTKGLMITSGDANASGDPVYSVDCAAAGLFNNEFAHFVVQFEGTAGITGVYVDGISRADSNTTAIPWWGNEDEGFVLGGRVLSARNFSGVDAVLDDFAIIPGVVNQAQVDSMRTLGVAGSGATTSLHYKLDEETGSTIGDSSGNGLNGTLRGFNNTQTRQAHGVESSLVSGMHGTAAKLRGGWDDYAKVETPANMPRLGEAFTVAFWLKVGAWDYNLYEKGVLFAQNFDDFGLVIGCEEASDGLIVRTATEGTTIHITGVNTTHLTPHEFEHFAITIDAAGSVSGIYINGELASQTISAGWVLGDEEQITLGARIRNGSLGFGLDCELDDFAIIKGQLTDTEIDYIMTHGVEALYSNVVLIPGDTNGDRVVNDVDAKALAANWGVSSGASRAMGDFNGDGKVNSLDASILAANWGYGVGESAQTAVPEPSVMALFAFVCLAVLATRRRLG